MALITHPITNLPLGDPELVPLERKKLPSATELVLAADRLILSASGWRKVFAAPDSGAERARWASPITAMTALVSDADEDSLGLRVAPADLVIAGAMALVFGDWILERCGRRDPALLLGIDARPTGPAIADLMVRLWLARGIRPRYLFIVAAPEIMAYSGRATSVDASHEDRAEGFCYISASHNPPAHNGVKFGVGGGVLPVAEANELIARFKALVADPDLPARVFALVDEAETKAVAEVYTSSHRWKRRAVSAYTLFSREVVTGSSDLDYQERLLETMSQTARERPIGVVAELNGSARTLSIDADFLGGLGVRVAALNDRPRAFAHRIVPEGASLEPARRALEAAHGGDEAYIAGYVPDCDGDRGNLVYWDERGKRAELLGAQEVFSLAVLAELALLVREGRLGRDAEGRIVGRVAVAVNDATSLRIEAIASIFGAETHRAETGEANVVGLAKSLRERGYLVRILGEGSNGGNITSPSEVRDPLATLGALLKLLLLRDSAESRGAEGADPAIPPKAEAEGLFHIWLRLSGQLEKYREDFGVGTILDSLPPWTTTSVFEPRAALRIIEGDQVALKRRYRPLFLRDWETRRAELERRFGVVGWKALASQGSGEREIGGDFADSGRGGLRIALLDPSGKAKGFIWMRGSGTEPVFRIMADIAGGSNRDEEWLLDWQTALVREADKQS